MLTVQESSKPMVPNQSRQPLPSQQQIYQQSQRGSAQPTITVRGQVKAYTLTVDQADASGKVVTGIILVHFVLAYVLLDFGATHCFISSKLISMHNISCDTVIGGWFISTESAIISCRQVCRRCP